MLTFEKNELKLLSLSDSSSFTAMTFPIYRRLLSLDQATRHPEQGDKKVIRPIAVGAFIDNHPAGLVLAEIPVDGERYPEILSLFVVSKYRGAGVGTALVKRLEELLRLKEFSRLTAVYMTGKTGIPAIERIFQKREWSDPTPRTVTLRFTPQQALSTPWFGRIKLSDTEYEIFPWAEVSQRETDELHDSQRADNWIAKGLEPWEHDQHGYDTVSSVGLRYKNRVVGWVINHCVAPGVVRFTCSFMRKDLGRRGRILPLYTASIKKLKESNCTSCVFVTPVVYKPMVDFVKRRCVPWATFFGETRGVIKVLGSSD